ncbi:LysR substrate-binding domain-containing protein [Variovorax sp.]|uniref:LysR substrate-binding domain-containing protein n=1 Tax=Variovorax sp. TaxID=1871043 RepID=UPI002D44C259|nr:LysR substrate-binding domain-containing protein [Variovorax sp.]HYP83696.1 LysR substrate-binding domain-containing protein [Variovorax sp.]
MKLHQLRDFVTTARSGSLRAAARQLGLTQPSLTKSIQQLEKELGCALFERSARGAVLSSAGRTFLPRAEAAINELQRGASELKQGGGSVNVALSAAITLIGLPDSVSAFQKKFPDVALRVISGSYSVMFPELRSGAVDFAIGPRPTHPLGDEYVIEDLFRNSRSVICRKGHPLQRCRSLAELTQAQWIVSGVTGVAADEHDRMFIELGLPVPRAAIQCEYGTALLTLLASTDMLAIMPRQWAESPVMSTLLSQIRIQEQLPGPDIVLIRRAGLPLTPAADWMLTLLRRHVEYDRRRREPGAAASSAKR